MRNASFNASGQINADPAGSGGLGDFPQGEERGTAGPRGGAATDRPSRAPLTPAERHQVQEMALVDGLSNSEIARRLGRDRGTVANVLKGDDTAALRDQLASEQRTQALQTLRSKTALMAFHWINAAGVAAEKGDHKPARDLLLHTHVIDPVAVDKGPQVRVQINLHGGPEPLSLTGEVVEADATSAPYDRPVAWQIAGGTVAAHANAGDGGFGDLNERRGMPATALGSQNFSTQKCSPSESVVACGIGLDDDGDGDV